MPTANRCPKCGSDLPQGALGGFCPTCLLMQGAKDSEPQAAAFTPPTPAELAPLFPSLEILELIGKGGMGVVYKARQPRLNRLVALKILAPERAQDPAFAGRFEKEAQALAQLSHPNIVTLHEFGQTGRGDTPVSPTSITGDKSVAAPSLFYFIMEFVDGVNLRQAMKAGRFTPEQALAVVPPVCEALQYAHNHGIVHRDIKPENLLLDKEGRVKIADFGLAKMLGADASGVGLAESQPAGTPQYMAPEQQIAPQQVDSRADIYSLGVVLYEMLTGELPADKLQPPSRKVQIDVRLDKIVLRALEKSPELRYQTAGEFRTQVETMTGSAGTARPEPMSQLSWAKWSPGQPPLVREICNHLTKAERREAFMRSMLFGLWNAGTWFAPFFAGMFLPSPLGWVLGFCALVIGLSFHSFIQGLMQEFLCNTQWSRQRGITLEQLYAQQRALQKPSTIRWLWFTAILGVLSIVVAAAGMIYFMPDSHSAATVLQLSWARLWELRGVTVMLMTLFGSTILGWIDVTRIRRSGGMIPGLKIAVFEGLFFPLLTLDAAFASVFAATLHSLRASWDSGMGPVLLILFLTGLGVLTIALIVWVDFLIIRAVWRAVNKGVAPQVPIIGNTGGANFQSLEKNAKPDERAKRFGKIALTICLGGLALPALLLALRLPADSGVLRVSWLACLGLTSICEIAAIVFGIIGWKSDAGKAAMIVAVVVVLFVAFGTGANYWMTVRQQTMLELRTRETFLRKMDEERNRDLRNQMVPGGATKAAGIVKPALASAAPIVRSRSTQYASIEDESGTVLLHHDNVDLLDVMFYRGHFASMHNGPNDSKTTPAGNEDGTIVLDNGLSFPYHRQQTDPLHLRFNRQDFNLAEGRVIVLHDDGTAEQLKLFPPLATAQVPGALAKLISAPPPAAAALKPVPPEAAARIASLRAWTDRFMKERGLHDDAAQMEFAKESARRTKEITSLLMGTVAEPFVKEQYALFALLKEAGAANDIAKKDALQNQLKAIREKIDKLAMQSQLPATDVEKETSSPKTAHSQGAYDYRMSEAYRKLSPGDREKLDQVQHDFLMLWKALDGYADYHNGNPPDSLDQLVPISGELPTDPFATAETARQTNTNSYVTSKHGWGYRYMRGARVPGNQAWCLSSVGLPDFPYLAEKGNVGLYVCKGDWSGGGNIIFQKPDKPDAKDAGSNTPPAAATAMKDKFLTTSGRTIHSVTQGTGHMTMTDTNTYNGTAIVQPPANNPNQTLFTGSFRATALCVTQGTGQMTMTGTNPYRAVAIMVPLTSITTSSPAAAALATTINPPQLRYLAWQADDTNQTDAIQGVLWRPDGTALTEHAERMKLPVPYHMPVCVSKGDNKTPRYLQLWFFHPDLDDTSFLRVTLLDPRGQPLPTDIPHVPYGVHNPDERGWFTAAASPGVAGQLPATVGVRLEYSIGSWQPQGNIATNFSGCLWLGDGVLLGAVGQAANGLAFVSLMRNDMESPRTQYDFWAITHDGRRFRGMSGSSGNFTHHAESFQFPVKLADVLTFRHYMRPIEKVEFTNVPLIPASSSPSNQPVEPKKNP